MATPSSKENITLNFKDGTSIQYADILFFSNMKQLLLNGANANIEIDKDKISSIEVAGQTFLIKEVENISPAVKIVTLFQ